MTKINPQEVYTTKEVQDYLKVSKSTIKRYLKNGIIRAKKVGGRYKILGKEVLKLVSPEVENKVKKKYLGFRSKVRDKIKDW